MQSRGLIPLLALPVIGVAVALALAGARSGAPAAATVPAVAACDYHARFVAPVNGWLPVGCNDPRPGFDVTNCPKLAGIYDLFPAKDAVPALLSPKFTTAAETLWLDDRAPVLGLKAGKDVRCYPLAILNWHCLVADTLGGQGVYVYFDPPSGLALARRARSRSRPMGLAGYGYQGVGLTYEQASGRLYDMFGGLFLSGPPALAGGFGSGDYQWLPLERMTWGQWRKLHETTFVLSRETGYAFDYGFDPYTAAALGPGGATENYWTSGTVLAPDGLRDKTQTLPDKAQVLGLYGAKEQWAVPLEALSGGKEVEIQTAAGKVTVHSHPSEDWYFATDEQGQPRPQVRMFWFAWKTRFPNTKVYRKQAAIETDG